MKLVKKGKDPKTEIWKATCGNCGSKFEAERGELKVTDDQREGPFARHVCTVCGQEMFFYPPHN